MPIVVKKNGKVILVIQILDPSVEAVFTDTVPPSAGGGVAQETGTATVKEMVGQEAPPPPPPVPEPRPRPEGKREEKQRGKREESVDVEEIDKMIMERFGG